MSDAKPRGEEGSEKYAAGRTEIGIAEKMLVKIQLTNGQQHVETVNADDLADVEAAS